MSRRRRVVELLRPFNLCQDCDRWRFCHRQVFFSEHEPIVLQCFDIVCRFSPCLVHALEQRRKRHSQSPDGLTRLGEGVSPPGLMQAFIEDRIRQGKI